MKEKKTKNRVNKDNRSFSTLIASDKKGRGKTSHETERYQKKAVKYKYEKYSISSVRVSNWNLIR